MTLPHRLRREALTGLLLGIGLLSLCSLSSSRPGDRAEGNRAREAAFSQPGKRVHVVGPHFPAEALRVARDRPAQGPPGPEPDKQLTPTAQASQEFDAATPGLDKVARLAFVSNGVDEWINDKEPGPNDPPPPANDPNKIPDGQIDRWALSPNGFNIWLMRHDGSEQFQITDMPGDERDPAYDPGATRLAFCNNQTGVYQIYTVDIISGNKTVRQITASPGNKTHPTWSADGTYIAYATDLNGPANRDIHLIRATGVGAPVPLAATPSDEYEPMWSPNGVWMLYTRNDGGITHVWRMDSGGANQEQLTNGGGDPAANDKNPAWRQDGLATQFAFASSRLTDITDTIRDFNIWTVGASGEITGSPPTPHSNADVTDTKDDIMPAYSPVLAPIPSAAPVRIFFTSYRMDKIGPPDGTAEPDIWAFVETDARPPTLWAHPSVSNRNPGPGSDVIIRAEPTDRDTGDSGIRSVYAFLKDPDSADDDAQGLDHKIFVRNGYSKSMEPPVAPTGCDAPYYEELDAQRVGGIELFDDGDPVNSGDEVAGDGIYSGIWTTPGVPSDFLIDIELTDNAGNFINYDDTYGFTTVSFTPRNNVLLVNDYCEGQAWMSQTGLNNDRHWMYPVESYYTLNLSGSGGAAANTFSDGSYAEGYDLWRVICRGAPDLATLSYYGPTSEVQLDPSDLTKLKEVPVANRCVFWAAPHTHDVWAADGTIVEAATQALLTTFVKRGGRLLVTGQDIAWALTMEGSVSNPFLTNVLGAQFSRDDNAGVDVSGNIVFQIEGVDGDRVADDPWRTDTHWGGPPPPEDDDPVRDMLVGSGTDGSVHSPYPDVITAAGSQVVYNYITYGTGIAGVRKEDPQSLSRVIFFAFPYEALHRRYTGTTPCSCRNKRHKLTHNALCYLRTGGIQGRVLGIPGGLPIVDPEPIVTVHDYQNDQILYAQRCQKDGTYVISGIAPDYFYLKATRPGYKIDHPNSIYVHGGLAYPTMDFVISLAQPGAITGLVTSLATGDPIANVTVTAVSATDPTGATPVPPALTAADGTYVIPNVPVDDYDVTADGSTATPPYGSDTQRVTTVPGGTVTQDFKLPAADGTLKVTVKDSVTKALLKDVTVEAILNRVVVGKGTTDDQGVATFDVPPAAYSVVADKPGYSQASANATVLSAQTVTLNLEMTPLPGGAIAGQVYRTSTPTEALGGVTVQVIVSGAIVAQAVTADTWTYPPGGGARYNYKIGNVPSGGRVDVRAVKTGFTVSPTLRTVVVDPGQTTSGVDFTVSALRTFPTGLQFFSVPFDYSQDDPFTVLGTPAGRQLKMAAWDVSLGRYATYPAAPADRLRLGMGYWLNQTQPQDLVKEGRRATSPYLIPLGVGWNAIGNPFLSAVDLYSLKVRDALGVVRPIQDAFSLGQVRNGLFAYGLGGYRLSTSLAPYSGYWMFAGQAVSLVVEDPGVTTAAAASRDQRELPKPQGGWLAPIVVWSAGMRDESNVFGIASDPDALSAPKPPPPAGDDYVYATFDAPDGGAPLAVDVRGEGDRRWTLTVRTTAARAPVTVTWPDLSQLPLTARPVLRDPIAGKTVSMRGTRQYTYRPRGESRRELAIEVSSAPQGLLVVQSAAASVQAQGVAIGYTLSRDAQVTAEVRNVAGRLVARPVIAKPMPAGASVHLWNARSEQGVAVPAGKYLVVLTARSEDGQQASALIAVNIRR